MNKTKILLGLLSTILTCYCSTASEIGISRKTTFVTVEEKIDLFNSLNIEYTHQVTMSAELSHLISTLSRTEQAQKTFNENNDYKVNTKKTEQAKFKALCANRSSNDTMIIKFINNAVGYGVFAGENILPNTFLGLYAGELKRACDLPEIRDYSFHCRSIIPYCPELEIDAQHMGNELRFINGSQHHANCAPYSFFTPQGIALIAYVSIANIAKNEQLLADYGDSYWQAHRIALYQELAPCASEVQATAQIRTNPKNAPSSFGSGLAAGLKKGFGK